jgi:phosphoglycerate dehydrogenase-like enzyme
MSAPPRFRVALTGDFYDAAGQLKYRDIGLDLLTGAPGIDLQRFPEHHPEIAPGQLAGVNGVVVLTPRVTTHSLSASQDLLGLGRFGVGFDSVDVAACTAADVALFITTGAVDYSVAEATVGWMLALVHHVRIKDQLVREGRWEARSRYMGRELRERTLGVVGFGGIGRALVKLLSSFGMQTPLVFDPFVPAAAIADAGAKSVSLEELLAQSDFVSLHCPLNEKTRNLIGARELGLMRPDAYLINTARGGVVEEDALHNALATSQIAGAALDCFAGEPLTAPTRWAELENVLLAPHSIAWTDELFRDIGRAACQGLLDLAAGKKPRGMVNPEVFERPTFQSKWKRIIGDVR